MNQFEYERIIEQAEKEIEFIENDDSLSDDKKRQAIKDVEREVRDMTRNY